MHLTDFEFGFFPHVGQKENWEQALTFEFLKRAETVRKVRVGLIHAYHALTSPSTVVGRAHANLFIPSRLCGSAETGAGVFG